MKNQAVNDPVRQYKRMMSQSKKLKDRLEDIMEVIPPCVSYGGTPITFDVDKFIVSLIGKGFPAAPVRKKLLLRAGVLQNKKADLVHKDD